MNVSLIHTVSCRRYQHGRTSDSTDAVAEEIRVTLQAPDGACRYLFAAPIDPEVLALGHAALEMTGQGQTPILCSAAPLRSERTLRPGQIKKPDGSLPRALESATMLRLVQQFIAAPGWWDGTGSFHRAAKEADVTLIGSAQEAEKRVTVCTDAFGRIVP